MFKSPIDDRLSLWVKHRKDIEHSDFPLEDVWDFWKSAPYIQYNKMVDPFYQKSWPSPWEMIVHNKYDDFTKAVMIGSTLKLTNRYKDDNIKIESYIDKDKKTLYNIVNINDTWVINYSDNGPTLLKDLPDTVYLENSVELKNFS
jgi:hypothetical protein